MYLLSIFHKGDPWCIGEGEGDKVMKDLTYLFLWAKVWLGEFCRFENDARLLFISL